MSTGSMSMVFMRNTRQKIVSASGAMSLLRPWKVSLHLAVDELDDDLDEGLELARHAGGRLARLRQEEEARAGRQHQREEQRVQVERHDAPSPTLTCQ